MTDRMLSKSENCINKRDCLVPCSLPAKYKLKQFSLNYFVIIALLVNWGRRMARLDARKYVR